MHRLLPLVLLIISLSLAGGLPRLDGAHSLAPADTTTFQLGTIDIRPGSHAIVRGHDLTGRVTASYRAGTAFLNGVAWREHLTRQEAAGSLRELETYMTSPQGAVAIHTQGGGSMRAAGPDAEAYLKTLRELEAAGWQPDKVKPGLVGTRALVEIAEAHGFKPRPPRVRTTLVSFPEVTRGILRPRWQLLTPWHHLSTPAVVDTAIFSMVRYGELSVLEIRTGRGIRTVRLPRGGMVESPVRDEATLYLSTGNSTVVALDLATQRPRWTRALVRQDLKRECVVINWKVTAPALGEGRVYLASQDGKVYALERASGRELWTYDAGSTLAAAPIFDRGTVYVAGFNNQLVALRALDGEPRWVCGLGEAIEFCSPVFLDGTVYLAGRGGSVFAVDADRGTFRWKRSVGRLFRGSMTGSAGLLCVADSSGIYGLDASTGSTRWTIAEGAQSPVYAAGLIFCVTHVGVLLVIDPENGSILERHDVAGICFFSHPQVENGYVLVPATSDSAGSLMCFDLKPPGQ